MGPVLLLALAFAALQPADFVRDERSRGLDFRYSWPAEASRLPGLRAALQRDMDEAHALVRESAGTGRDRSEYSAEWQIHGRSERLLSLSAQSSIHHSGAAETNTNFQSLLWDRAGDQAVALASVLGDLDRFTERYCGELERERYEKSEGLVEEGVGDDCPDLTEQTLALADLTSNGRFDSLLVMMSPGIAAPHSHGAYFVEIPLEESDFAGIPPVYRADFEQRE